MRRVLTAPLIAVLAALASCSSPEAPPPAAPVSTPAPTPSRTPSPTPTGPIPDVLPNGWVIEPRLAERVNSIAASLNEVYPDADLQGAAYRDLVDPNLDKGALVLLVGDGRVNEGVFDALVVGGVTEQLREFTYCAEAGEGEDREMACFTDTAPSVVLRHSGADRPIFTLSELAAQAAAFQAGLGGGPTAEPEPEPEPEPTEPWHPSAEVDWENYAAEVKTRIDRLGRRGNCRASRRSSTRRTTTTSVSGAGPGTVTPTS
jgi:hypothetical protein